MTQIPHSSEPSPGCKSKEDGFPKCEPMAGEPVPPRRVLSTRVKLQDLGTRNFSEYLVKTRLDFKMKLFLWVSVRA